jgi:hypothetical protein
MNQHIVGYNVKAVAVPPTGHALSSHYSHDNSMRYYDEWKRSVERTRMSAIASYVLTAKGPELAISYGDQIVTQSILKFKVDR